MWFADDNASKNRINELISVIIVSTQIFSRIKLAQLRLESDIKTT